MPKTLPKAHVSRSLPSRRVFGGALAAAVVLSALLVTFTASPAQADRRTFGYSYPYMTLPKGGFELEHYLDARFKEMDDPSTEAVENDYEVDWEHQVEAEYGITDRWDFGLYHVFRQKPFKSFTYRGAKLRTRYRFAEQGELFVDPAIYFEVAYKHDEVELEQRIILSKILGPVELGFNLKIEQEFKLDKDVFELGLNPTFGVGYHFNEWLALAVEYYGDMKVEDGEYEYFSHYVGPTVSVAGNHFWWTLAFQKQVSSLDDQADFQVRSVFAVVF